MLDAAEVKSAEVPEALELLAFWLEAGHARWFDGGEEFDTACGRYRALWERAATGACDHWAQTAAGSLALIVLLDQIPRNVMRGSARQFETDARALAAAEAAVRAGYDKAQPVGARMLFYLPFEHAENMAAQERGLDLMRVLGDQDAYYWALVHADAIRRFGRFPHRNAMLGRQTTPAEKAYLETGGFGA